MPILAVIPFSFPRDCVRPKHQQNIHLAEVLLDSVAMLFSLEALPFLLIHINQQQFIRLHSSLMSHSRVEL